MKYLVTGGAGFLGSNLCHELFRRGHQVLCVDNLMTGWQSNLDGLFGNSHFSFIKASAEEIYRPEIDGIFHLASCAAPTDIQRYEKFVYFANKNATQTLFENYWSVGSKFLFTSTMKIHGDCDRVDAYIRGKRAGEKICSENSAKVARLASVYGPRMSVTDSRVIPVFITRALRKLPLSVWNGGAQLDSFCYVDDIVRALIDFMESDHTGTIELGSPLAISIMDLARIILELTKSNSVILTHESIPVINECHRVPDLIDAHEFLHWKPVINLREGLKKTIDYFRKELQDEASS
jgi:nucleoside-diphosphate-sugar epimerase